MKPVEIVFGERYGDDSGWERRLAVSTADPALGRACRIDLSGGSLTCTYQDLVWLEHAISDARGQVE